MVTNIGFSLMVITMLFIIAIHLINVKLREKEFIHIQKNWEYHLKKSEIENNDKSS